MSDQFSVISLNMSQSNQITSRVKVLYIGGAGRSGSTILNNILGQIDGFFATGELGLIWKWGLIENRPCACGKPFRECEVWPKVFETGYGGMEAVDAQRVWRQRNRVNSQHPIGHIWSTLTIQSRRDQPELVEYASMLDRLYTAVQHVTGSRVIVDASKRPGYSYFVSTLPSVDLYLLHLVRDPRGIAFSRRRGKVDTGINREMRNWGPLATGVQWTFWNGMTELFWNRRGDARYMRLRYEDFVARPRESLMSILRFAGEADCPVPLVNENQVMIHPTHTVAGNPVRYDSGLTTLRLDNEWITEIAAGDRWLVTALTWPLLLRYGYPLWPRANST